MYFGQNIPYGFHVNLPSAGTATPIMVHMDDASRRQSKETLTSPKEFIFQPALHPPDLARSDFHFLGRIKKTLRWRSFHDTGEPMEAFRDVTPFIRLPELDAVFRNWEDRLRKAIEFVGE
jgi:hypothetical protein